MCVLLKGVIMPASLISCPHQNLVSSSIVLGVRYLRYSFCICVCVCVCVHLLCFYCCCLFVCLFVCSFFVCLFCGRCSDLAREVPDHVRQVFIRLPATNQVFTCILHGRCNLRAPLMLHKQNLMFL